MEQNFHFHEGTLEQNFHFHEGTSISEISSVRAPTWHRWLFFFTKKALKIDAGEIVRVVSRRNRVREIKFRFRRFEVDGCKKWSPPPDLNRGPADFSGCIGFFRRHSTVSRSSQSELGGDKPRIQSLYINFSFGPELPASNPIRSTRFGFT